MKKHEPLSSAKAVSAFLVLSIVFVLYWKFKENETLFLDDPSALKSYVLLVFVAVAFLIGLMYLVSNVDHKPRPKPSKKK